MENEIEINGVTYLTGTLDTFKQMKIAKRIMKVIPELAKGGVDTGLQLRIMNAVGAMEDDDMDTIVKLCLGVVKRKLEGDKGVAGIISSEGIMMYKDIGLQTVLKLCVKVITENMADFFTDLLPSSNAPDAAADQPS